MNIKFIAKVCASLYYCKHESKYSKIPCFVEMKLRQQLNFLVYQKQNLWFSTTSTYNSSYSFQNSVSKDILQKDVHGLFNEHKANEESYQRKFKTHLSKVCL
jgi:hypothetical protein